MKTETQQLNSVFIKKTGKPRCRKETVRCRGH